MATSKQQSRPKSVKARRVEGPVDLAEEVVEHVPTEEPLPSFEVTDRQEAREEQAEREKTELRFYGSDLLRLRLPKTFEFAEAVADEWKNDGRFEALPVRSPMAQLAAQVGLRKAKDLEKKLEEKGVFQLARTGLEYAKTKLRK